MAFFLYSPQGDGGCFAAHKAHFLISFSFCLASPRSKPQGPGCYVVARGRPRANLPWPQNEAMSLRYVRAARQASIGLNDRPGSWAARNQTKGVYSKSHDAQRYFRRGQAFESSENQMNWFVLRRAQVRWRILAIRIRFIVLMRSNRERRAAEDKRFVTPLTTDHRVTDTCPRSLVNIFTTHSARSSLR